MGLDNTQLPKEKVGQFYEAVRRMRAAQSKPILGKCMFWTGNCNTSPIGSHLIARSWLQQVSDSTNHILQLKINSTAIGRQSARFVATRTGINEATTFPGFCETHDSDVFGCVERAQFEGSTRQLLALRYRSVCREACAKHQMVACILQNPSLENAPAPLQIRLAADMKRCMRLLVEKGELERAIQANLNILESYVIRFAKKPTVLASATFYPWLTFTGRRIEPREEMITVTILPAADWGGWAVFSWLKSAPKNSALVVKSFRKIATNYQSQALLNLVLESTENHAISPQWWATLTQSQQREAINRFERVFGEGFVDNIPPDDALRVKCRPWIDWEPIESRYVL
jgi:hypothetical protein